MATAQKTDKKLKPLNDKIIVEKAPAEEKTEGGLYLPSSSQEKPQEGTIVAAGPGILDDKGERKPLQVKEGDKVLYSKYSGTEIKINRKELLIMSEKDVLAIIEN